MLPIYSETYHTLDGGDLYWHLINSDKPSLVWVVSGDCWNHSSIETQELQDVVKSYTDRVNFHVVCIEDSEMNFPRIQDNTLYFFRKQSVHPVFWRHPIPAPTLEEDVRVIELVSSGMTYEEARYPEAEQQLIQRTEMMLERESSEQYPPLFTQMRSFAKDMWKTARQGMRHLPVLVPAEEAYRRMEICRGCDKYNSVDNRCLQCGCNMSIKTNLATSSCPLGKW